MHDTGTGAAVLFLHAFTLDGSQWDHQVAALSDDLRCIRIDLWGCGSSPAPPDGEPTLDGFANAALAVLDSLHIERFAVVGLSMGGYLAFALWRLAPERIRALVLCNTRAAADSAAARADRIAMAEQVERDQSVESIVEPMVARLLSPHARSEAHIVDPVRGRIRRCTPAGIVYAQRAMAARPDSTELLASITVPSLVIAGSQDAIITTSEVHAMADSIPGASYAELDCGHLSNLELPRAVSEQLARFLVPARMAS
ncbi:MAG: alpha/beta fold hydrolase [Candidatus Dormibacteria bacterium]